MFLNDFLNLPSYINFPGCEVNADTYLLLHGKFRYTRWETNTGRYLQGHEWIIKNFPKIDFDFDTDKQPRKWLF